MHARPRPPDPLVGGALVLARRPGPDRAQVLQHKQLPAMGKRGGIGRPPVVGPTPRRELQATVLAGHTPAGKAVDQRRNRLAGQGPIEELRLGEAAAPTDGRRRRWLGSGAAALGLEPSGVQVRQPPAGVAQRVGVGTGHQLLE
jgi:hypothetical protein